MTTTFATTINCMDGRVQLPVLQWMMQRYKVTYVDSITEPGPIKILAEQDNLQLLHSIKKRLEISINTHGSQLLTVVGHYDCAGNPVSKEMQQEQLKKSIALLKQWFPTITIHPLWVDNFWNVQQLTL